MKYTKSLGILSLIAGTFLMSGCDSALLNPKGQIALEQRSLILTAFGLMLIVVIPAVFMAIMFAWKYRASNTNAKYSPNWSHSNKFEAVVWANTYPDYSLSWRVNLEINSLTRTKQTYCFARKPVEIDVIALDWKWLFIYPEQGIATVNEIAFPANRPVSFKITSNSVMNSFFIPTLGSQIYAMAGMQTNLHLIANEPGIFDGISSNYSGRGFSGMKFKAIATKDDAEFQQWVAKVKTAPTQLTSMAEFEKLAAPSENSPVTYFSSAKPELFNQVIDKFMSGHGDMKMSPHMDMHMNHSASAAAEE